MRCTMKKFLTIFLFIFLYIYSFTSENQDYTLFLQGKEAYYSKNYPLAKQNFETLLKSFPNSNIFSNNYAYFFIGMNYYYLKEYHKASYYLEKAVYTSNKLLNDNVEAEKAHLFAERDFALGDSLMKIGDNDKAIIYLKRINYNTFYPFVAYYERKALEILKNFSPIYEKKLQLKFNYDFSVIDSFDISDLIQIGDFYLSQKAYLKAEEFYSLLLKRKNIDYKDSKEVYKGYFNALFKMKKYDKILELTQNTNATFSNLFKYYRGLTYYQLRDFPRALFLFDSITTSDFYSKANYYSASIYFTLGEYKNVLNHLKLVSDKNITTDTMAAFSYFYLNDKNNAHKAAIAMAQKYPNTYVGLYFKYLLSNNILSLKLLNSLEDLINFSNIVLDNEKKLPADFITKADILEVDHLSQISQLGEREILRLNFNRSSLAGKSNFKTGYLTTLILEKGEFYELAFENSKHYLSDFSEYKELFKYDFPLYYHEIVEYCSKKYDVSPELIYTIMHDITGFNPYYISDDSRFGLMGIPYTDSNSFNFFELFDPKDNIEEGTKILKKYLKKYQGNKIKTLVAYIYGEAYVNELYFDYTNDINLSSITIPEERFFLQNIFMTYIFYLKLYEL